MPSNWCKTLDFDAVTFFFCYATDRLNFERRLVLKQKRWKTS